MAVEKIEKKLPDKIDHPQYIERGGQIVSGFLGSKLEKDWNKKLPTGITKDMVYLVPQSYGYEWRLGYLYIEDEQTREEFYKDELNWSVSQPESGVYDPRKKRERKTQNSYGRR